MERSWNQATLQGMGIVDSEKSSRTFPPVIQDCDHVLWYLLGQGRDGLIIELSRTTPQQDSPYA